MRFCKADLRIRGGIVRDGEGNLRYYRGNVRDGGGSVRDWRGNLRDCGGDARFRTGNVRDCGGDVRFDGGNECFLADKKQFTVFQVFLSKVTCLVSYFFSLIRKNLTADV